MRPPPDPAPSLLRQADALARAVFPAGFLILLLVLAALPLGLPGLVPAVCLPCVFFWSVFRPAGLPPPAVFGIGLMQDLLIQAPLGLSVLVLLVCQGVTLRIRGLLAQQSFLLIWLAYLAVASGAAALSWGLQSLLSLQVLPPAPALYGIGLTVGLYPSLSYVLGRMHQMMRQAEGAV